MAHSITLPSLKDRKKITITDPDTQETFECETKTFAELDFASGLRIARLLPRFSKIFAVTEEESAAALGRLNDEETESLIQLIDLILEHLLIADEAVKRRVGFLNVAEIIKAVFSVPVQAMSGTGSAKTKSKKSSRVSKSSTVATRKTG